MRAQERKFPKTKTETKGAFKERLRQTALGLPMSLVKRAVGSMKRRCEIVSRLKGGLFTE
jgi:acyl CoA:acetate/3-ketoacid CoA transferase alpha subunit